MEQVSVSIDPSVLSMQYQKMISKMQSQLEKEQALRKMKEAENSDLKKILSSSCRQKSKKTAVQRREEQKAYQERQLTGLKSNGIPIAHSGEGISSYSEYKILSDYLWEIKQYKMWLLWNLGIATGVRISDLSQLTVGFFYCNGEFRERFPKVEKKTGKLNNILITDFMKEIIKKYLSVTGISSQSNDPLFPSREKFKYDFTLSEEENELRKIKKEKGYAAGLSQRLKKYGEQVGLRQKSSHSMRHSFANIVLTLYNESGNSKNLNIVSGLLNHYDLKTTARYCDCFQSDMDAARILVSDFLLGKTEIKDLKLKEQ